MSKGGRKGRISNELVAASCAAILTVYAGGYWRTREEARRLGSEADARPVRPAQTVAAVPPDASAASTAPELPDATTVPVATTAPAVSVTSAPDEPQPTAKQALKATAAPLPAVTALEPSKPAVAVIASVVAGQATAPEPEAAAAEAIAQPPMWRDGSFTGWGQSRHGDIEAYVTIRDGRIIESGILNCDTRYPCSVIDSILNQPVEWQSPDVDKVTRATVSANAYYWGLVEALKKAEIAPAVPASASP